MSRENETGRRIPLIERKIIRPFKFILLGILIGFILFYFMINSLNSMLRAKVATANAEMRNLAIALESYEIDWNSYPPGNPFVGDLAERTELTSSVGPQKIARAPYLASIPEAPVWIEFFIERNYYRLVYTTLAPAIFIFCMIWYLIYKRLHRTELVKLWETVVVWFLGIIICIYRWDIINYFFLPILLLPSIASSILWLCYYSLNIQMLGRLPPGRAILLCIVLPLLFGLKIAHSSWVQQYAESTVANSRQTVSYLYATDATSYWILLSTGPDNVYDFNRTSCPINADATEMAAWIKQTDSSGKPNLLEYDPTNGTLSTGDIYRASFP